MPSSGRQSHFFPAAIWAFLLIGGLPAVAAPAKVPPETPRLHRPQATVIRETARKILDDPAFAPQKTLWQIVLEWFENKFKNTHFPKVPEGLATVLLWVLVIWSILALLAILGHLIWTIAIFLRGRTSSLPHDEYLASLRPEQRMTFDELMARIKELSAKGDFRQAAALMMIALFKRLDQAGLVRFHESKTNGDYIREFPSERPGRLELGQLALAFDETVYGGKECDRQTYQYLYGFFERIQTYVGQKP